MKLFLDSSALAKRYIQEAGSAHLEALLAKATVLGVCVTCLPEIVSALCRKSREGNLRREEYEMAKNVLLTDMEDAEVVQLTSDVVAVAIALLEKHSLRAMDALQIGSAVRWESDLFASADRNQLRAAAKRGLHVKSI